MGHRIYGIVCPNCGSRCSIRSSREVTPLIRQYRADCSNDNCAASYGADLTITHVIAPSGCPNPAVMLRSVPPRRPLSLPAPANDGATVEPPLPANDTESAMTSSG